MTVALPIRTFPSFLHLMSNPRSSDAGLLQVLRNPAEWKSAATVAIIFFIASLALAPALTRDQNQLASEINAKTLKAAAALKPSPRLALPVQ